jgi:hypothetical protein
MSDHHGILVSRADDQKQGWRVLQRVVPSRIIAFLRAKLWLYFFFCVMCHWPMDITSQS